MILLGVLLIIGLEKNLTLGYFFYIFERILFQLVGFWILAIIYNMFLLCVRKDIVAFFITYGIFLLFTALKIVLNLSFTTLEEYMFLILENSSNLIDISSFLGLNLIFFILYYSDLYISKTTDKYWGY